MSNFREVNENDILKQWYECMDESYLCHLTDEDKKHDFKFDEFREKILKTTAKQNRKYIQKQLDLIYDEFMNYIIYINEKYYRNGFVDGVQMIMGCVKEIV